MVNRVGVNRKFPAFYRIRSAYTGNKISNQSGVLAVILLDRFSKNKKIKISAAQREREFVCSRQGKEKGVS